MTDIEREVDLGGAIHSKGVLILSSFLASRYAKNHPLSLSASLVFEQSYGMVDGDSASVAELCALLSALSSVPIKQSLAVTGSVNQHGQVQPIGGVNEKIEGFFDVCRGRGLPSLVSKHRSAHNGGWFRRRSRQRQDIAVAERVGQIGNSSCDKNSARGILANPATDKTGIHLLSIILQQEQHL